MKKEIYKKSIVFMLKNINDEKFLNQIQTLLKLHIQKKGASHNVGIV